MTGAVKKIEKIQKGLSKQIEVEDALRKANESVNEAGMEMNKLKDAIKMFQKKIDKQGRVTNARDEEHLKNLIKLYIQMGGKGVKESVNEAVKVRNGETPMEGKWGVYDNSTGKAIKEVGNARAATRLMNRLMTSGQYKEVAAKWIGEPVNEANIKDIEKVLKTKSAKKIDGMYMDMTTANAIMTVYKALNTTNKKKFAKLPLKKMVTVTWKLVK